TASDRFTPADVTHAAQQVAQLAFERTLHAGERVRAGTDDYLAAIARTRPTLSAQDVTDFAADIERYQRS
ncbi:MAG: AAA family ATPase, partial [Frankiales bacterium]|nr:AAA family ATPase [Frankiales bacterium]